MADQNKQNNQTLTGMSIWGTPVTQIPVINTALEYVGSASSVASSFKQFTDTVQKISTVVDMTSSFSTKTANWFEKVKEWFLSILQSISGRFDSIISKIGHLLLPSKVSVSEALGAIQQLFAKELLADFNLTDDSSLEEVLSSFFNPFSNFNVTPISDSVIDKVASYFDENENLAKIDNDSDNDSSFDIMTDELEDLKDLIVDFNLNTISEMFAEA